MTATLAVSIGLLLSIGSDCAMAEQTDVVLRLWHIPTKGSTQPLWIAQRRVFEAFCREHPKIKVEALVPLKIEGPAAGGNEFLAVAGGVAPDVFSLSGRKIGDYYSQGFLSPLDNYLKEYEESTGEPYRGISAPSVVWEPCQIDGHVYAVPSSYYSMALNCRSDLFARAGIPLRSPRDWDEFYEFARRLTWLPSKEPEAKPRQPAIYGLHLNMGRGAGFHFQQYIYSAGGEIVRSYYPTADGQLIEAPPPPTDYRSRHISISDSETYYPQMKQLQRTLQARGIPPDYSMADLQWRLVTDEPAAIKALELYRRLVHSKWIRCENRHDRREFDLTTEMLTSGRAVCPVCSKEVDLNTPSGRRRIYQGVVFPAGQGQRNWRVKSAMGIATPGEVNVAPDLFTVVALPFPSIRADVDPAACVGGGYLAINVTQTDERVREAAWKYIKFVTGPQAQKIRVQTYIDNGLAEFIRPSSLAALGYDIELSRIPTDRLAVWSCLDKYPKVEPYCKGFQHIMTRQLTMAIDAVMSDEPDAQGHFSRDLREVMSGICEDANKLKLGKPPQEVLDRRARIGWVIMSVIVLLLGLGVWSTIRFAVKLARKAANIEGLGVHSNTIRRTLVIVLFLTPAVGSVSLWQYYPLIRGTAMAFQDFKIVGQSKWVGLENFILTASSPEFWRYLLQTFEYLALSLALGFFAPVILAIFLNEVPRGKVLYRTIYYLPAVTSGLVVMFMWKNLLYEPSESGFINGMILFFNDRPPAVMVLLKFLLAVAIIAFLVVCIRAALSRGTSLTGRIIPSILAIPLAVYVVYCLMSITQGDGVISWLQEPWYFRPQTFLRDPQLAMFWIVVPTVWAGMGPGCLIYLAALKGVPEEQYEAADLDGAGVWSKCTNVVFPNLSALILISLVGAVVGAMHASSNIFVMTGGGPEDVTMTVGLNVWYNAYMFLNFGLATSQAWVLGAMLIGFALYQLRILNRMQFSTAGTKEAVK